MIYLKITQTYLPNLKPGSFGEVIGLLMPHCHRVVRNVMVRDGCLRSLSGGSFIASQFHVFSLFGTACVGLCSVITEAADTAAAGHALTWWPHVAVLADSCVLRK